MPRKGYIMTPEHRANLSVAAIGRKQSTELIEKRISPLRGRPQSPELIAKRAAALRGRKISAEQVAALLRGRLAKPLSDESRRHMSDAQRGRKHSEETKSKIAAAHRGRTLSDEAKAKISKAHTGRKHSADTRAKVSAALRLRKGPLSGNWKGGITSGNTALRNDEDVRLWRRRVFEHDHFTCRRCEKIGGYLNAHHILPFKKFVEFRTDLFNGITLCRPCHKLVHADMRHERSKVARST